MAIVKVLAPTNDFSIIDRLAKQNNGNADFDTNPNDPSTLIVSFGFPDSKEAEIFARNITPQFGRDNIKVFPEARLTTFSGAFDT